MSRVSRRVLGIGAFGLAVDGLFSAPGLAQEAQRRKQRDRDKDRKRKRKQRRRGRRKGPDGPNVIVIVMDDRSTWDLQYGLPWCRQQAGRFGTSWRNFVFENPVCAPSRSTILTGRSMFSHRVLTNGASGGPKGWNFMDALHHKGWRVGRFGKFVGGWEEGDFEANGRRKRETKDDRVRKYGVKFVRRHAGHRFALWLGCQAPHEPHLYAKRHAKLYPNAAPPNNPAVNEPDNANKPTFIRNLQPIPEAALTARVRDRLRALAGADDVARAVWREVKAAGIAKQTTMFVLSDNGFCIGEHRWYDKGVPYDPATRATVMAWGRGFAPGVVNDNLVSNLDVAPTIANLTGVQPGAGWAFQGADLRTQNRDHVRLAYRGGTGGSPHFDGIKTLDHLYAEYPASDERELYDLTADPWELDNLLANPNNTDALALADEFRAMLAGDASSSVP